jgi:hypothetical protein
MDTAMDTDATSRLRVAVNGSGHRIGMKAATAEAMGLAVGRRTVAVDGIGKGTGPKIMGRVGATISPAPAAGAIIVPRGLLDAMLV